MPHKVNVQSLPEDIALRITSKLTLKEAARTSVLSSVWKQACVFHPNLYFGIETEPGGHAKGEEVCSDPRKRMLTISKFIERVDAILKNHCGTQMSGFTWFPLKFISLKHLTMELTCWGNTKSVLQLAYLLEAAPLLEDLYFEMLGLGPISCPVEDVVDIMDLPHYHLKTVCITRFCDNDGQVELAKYILKNASILEHLILKLGGGEGCTSRVYILHGRKEAKERLAPLARDGVLTIL
ncbi:unnamed protein product [Urochloa decumbens]|uniref:At1g61320/AtMIF1 LRR domain-containing protein n=1 Tax=Urochloa decumbens TaxID=240449 RepID=A0ABC9GPF0_9POAL